MVRREDSGTSTASAQVSDYISARSVCRCTVCFRGRISPGPRGTSRLLRGKVSEDDVRVRTKRQSWSTVSSRRWCAFKRLRMRGFSDTGTACRVCSSAVETIKRLLVQSEGWRVKWLARCGMRASCSGPGRVHRTSGVFWPLSGQYTGRRDTPHR